MAAAIITLTRSPAPSGANGLAGGGIGADGLANTQVGGTSCGCANLETAYRFRAATTSSLANIRIYLVDGLGYAGGDGGTVEVSVQSDDGTADHNPSGTVLASKTILPGNPISGGSLPLLSFGAAAALVEGEIYDIVFRNIDAQPTTNFVSLDSLWTRRVTVPRQLGLPDSDWAQLINDGSGWAVRPNYTPILDIGYTNGIHQGVGYMEVWADAAKKISGSSAVREIFTAPSTRSIADISVRISRLSGTDPLSVSLIDAETRAVVSATAVPAASFAQEPEWASDALPIPVQLNSGHTYQLVLSTPATSSYSAVAIERGNDYMFSPATYFSVGYAQYSTGDSEWSGFDQPGGSTNNTNADLQFLLH